MVAAVIAITGGFVIDAGPLYFSAHRLLPPFIVAAAAYALAARQGHTSIVAADAALAEFIHVHAVAIVVVLAAAAAGVGVAFGTYVAAGSDPTAYLSQARLIAHGDLVVPVPLASRVSWPTPEWAFAPLGYRPGLHAAEIVPTYPPGLPLLMAVASFIAGENGPFLVGPFFAIFTVLGAYWLAAHLHSRTAGVVAAALMASSPLLLSQVVQQMSDIPATALWTLALLAALSTRPLTAGAIAGLAVLMRPSLLPVAGAVALVLMFWCVRPPASRDTLPVRRPPEGGRGAARLFRFGAAMMPGVAALAWVQWLLYGHPLASGHGAFAELFAAANVLPNIRDYAMRVLTGETPALALIAASALVLAGLKNKTRPTSYDEAGPKSRTRPTPVDAGPKSRTRPTPVDAGPKSRTRPTVVAAIVAVPVLACDLAYGVFPDWAYLRFLLPIWPAALAAAGALVASATLRLPAAARTQILLIGLTAVCARNVMTALHEGTFTLWIDVSRYGTAGRYLESALPANAVIVTSQHSGSASYYTGRPILRWDSLTIGLDEALADLARLGRPSVILVEDWEETLLRQKFPSSAPARLDWPARADFGRTTHVRLYDPADRDRPTGRPTDRLP